MFHCVGSPQAYPTLFIAVSMMYLNQVKSVHLISPISTEPELSQYTLPPTLSPTIYKAPWKDTISLHPKSKKHRLSSFTSFE